VDKYVVTALISGFLGVIVHATIVEPQLAEYRNAITECEKSLPRDEFCEIIAIPAGKKDGRH